MREHPNSLFPAALNRAIVADHKHTGTFPMRSSIRCFHCVAITLAAVLFSSPLLAGEPQWVEVRSPNFSVVTDAGEKRGREVAMRFEQMRGVYGALMTKTTVNLPAPLQIVAFRNTKELRQVAPLFNGKPTELAGLFQGGGDRSFIMLDMSVDNPWTVVFHEYAHQLMNGTMKVELDPWFQEGFAEYFSSIEVDSKEARVGKILSDQYLVLHQFGMVSIADLLKVRQNSATYNESGSHRNTFYAESGMLMHYIYDNQLLPKVAVYFDLKENKHLRVEDAIQKAFGMSVPQFDKALRSYVNDGHYRYYPITNSDKISSSGYIVTPMSVTNARAVLADIHLHSQDYRERALVEFQDILKTDPNNATACRGLGYAYLQKQNFEQAAGYFNRAAQLDSKDPRVHYYSALLMSRENGFGRGNDMSSMIKELETSISLDPNFADSYALLSFAQSSSGDPARALVTMQKALAISPRNEVYLFNLANLYLANRQPGEAVEVLQSLQGTSNPELAQHVTAMLAQSHQFAEMTEGAKMGEVVDIDTPGQEDPDTAAPVTSSPAPQQSGPAKFLTGTLTAADCGTPPGALLTVVSGTNTWKMKVADRNHFVLIGADEFSCFWTKKKVAINYRETGEKEASVISLEIQ